MLETQFVDDAPLARLRGVAPAEQLGPLVALAARVRDELAGRSIWHVNATAQGGGVAEMLAAQLPYLRGAGLATRWAVLDAQPDFFVITKRIHNQLHGDPGDGGGLDEEARRAYERALEPNASALVAELAPGDVVFLHDPQTAGLVPTLRAAGARVVWRCHVGTEEPNDEVRAAWDFLRSYVALADRCVFTCPSHVWTGLDADRVALVAPSIDPLSPKNQDMTDATVAAVLAAAGLQVGGIPLPATAPGTGSAEEARRAGILGGPVPVDAPLVVQVSRWDRLKDHLGVLRAFVDHVDLDQGQHLVLAGPEADGVDDDPEQAAVLASVQQAWQELPPRTQAQVHVATLPMEDGDENSRMVNALQRRATVVVQKSIAEGFGLTVAEAMWKGRPVVASARGGITEQIEDGASGVLLQDPGDGRELATALEALIRDPERSQRLGAAGQKRIRDRFLITRELIEQLELVEVLAPARA